MFIEIAHAASETAAHAAEAAATSHETQSGLLGTFGIDWKLFLAQLVNFGIIIFVLTKWVYKPLMKTMDERKQKIEDGVKNAEEAAKKMVHAREEEEEILRGAHKQAKEVVDDAKARGDVEKQRRVDASKEIIDKQLVESKERIKRETDQARQQAKGEIAELVVHATEKVANGSLDEKKHRNLIADAIKELETSHG